MKPYLNEREIVIELQDFPDGSEPSEIDGEDDVEYNCGQSGLDIVNSVFDTVFKEAINSTEATAEVVDCSPQPSTSSNISKKKEEARKWRKKEKPTERPDYTESTGSAEYMFAGCDTPTDVLLVLIEKAVDLICYQSNLYGTQNNKNLNMKKEELLTFIGINFLMGYHKLPSWKDFWSTARDLHVQPVAEAMSRDRFAMILAYLHVNDNHSIPADNKDKLYKLRPLIDLLNEKFKEAYHGTREVSVDETMIKFKGRSSIKQYNPMKPIKRGYKLWCVADQNGYILAFRVYQGKNEQVEAQFDGYGLGERVVLDLTSKNREVYFDNYFSSPHLLERLAAAKTLACGTVRGNRKGLPGNVSVDQRRGNSDSRMSNTSLSFYVWKVTKVVNIISNSHGSDMTTVTRKKCHVTLSLQITKKHMGGVDFADRLRFLYDVDRRS